MRLTSDEMRDIAAAASRSHLIRWAIPDEVKECLVLGIGPVDDGGEGFILYIPADIPSERQRISRTVVSREGEVLTVEIYEDVLRELGATKAE